MSLGGSFLRPSARYPDVAGSILSLLSLQHSVMEVDHEIFYMVILSLLLIQEGQLLVSGIKWMLFED